MRAPARPWRAERRPKWAGLVPEGSFPLFGPRGTPACLLRCKTYSGAPMGSFRKRLLVLIIGLVIVTQTVTLAAVLVSTRRTVETRAAEQLRSGGTLGAHLMGFRAARLANAVAVLAADFGCREAVASGHAPTVLSAARNNAQRIGA